MMLRLRLFDAGLLYSNVSVSLFYICHPAHLLRCKKQMTLIIEAVKLLKFDILLLLAMLMFALSHGQIHYPFLAPRFKFSPEMTMTIYHALKHFFFFLEAQVIWDIFSLVDSLQLGSNKMHVQENFSAFPVD